VPKSVLARHYTDFSLARVHICKSFLFSKTQQFNQPSPYPFKLLRCLIVRHYPAFVSVRNSVGARHLRLPIAKSTYVLLDASVGAYGCPSGRSSVIMKVVFFPFPMNGRPPKRPDIYGPSASVHKPPILQRRSPRMTPRRSRVGAFVYPS